MRTSSFSPWLSPTSRLLPVPAPKSHAPHTPRRRRSPLPAARSTSHEDATGGEALSVPPPPPCATAPRSHICFFTNTRHLLPAAQAMVGFYGNCFYTVKATRASGEVAAADVVDVVRAIRDAKPQLAIDFARWAAGGFDRDPYELTFTCDSLFVSDWTRLGFLEADYG